MALNMLSKNKKKAMKRDMGEQERQEKELKERILRKKADDEEEKKRIRGEFKKQDKLERQKLNEELEVAT